AQLEGFDTMVSLSENAPVAVFEGDEYLSSPIDRRPKFHRYHPHIALISGIAWDHINVFPTFKEYIDQFRIFAEMTDPEGILIYCDCDETLVKMIHTGNIKACKIPYSTHPAVTRDGVTFLQTVTGDVPIRVFGDHNLQNISGAKIVCNEAGIGDEKFYEAISTFKGASKRLQLLSSNKHTSIFLDFAHSPSKLKATTTAVKKQYPDRRLVACMELHTFSSLNEHFLEHYNGSMASADTAFIYFNPETIRHKKLKEITPQQVHKAFGEGNIEVFTDKDALTGRLLSTDWQGKNLLLMSSGNFSGIDFQEFAGKIIGEK
ncbi:MAG: peptidoglycan synthetase, partial [Bacteroidetes bacterium]|nr:peptidoglycan synthetase [Bacteroidota bacterium]